MCLSFLPASAMADPLENIFPEGGEPPQGQGEVQWAEPDGGDPIFQENQGAENIFQNNGDQLPLNDFQQPLPENQENQGGIFQGENGEGTEDGPLFKGLNVSFYKSDALPDVKYVLSNASMEFGCEQELKALEDHEQYQFFEFDRMKELAVCEWSDMGDMVIDNMLPEDVVNYLCLHGTNGAFVPVFYSLEQDGEEIAQYLFVVYREKAMTDFPADFTVDGTVPEAQDMQEEPVLPETPVLPEAQELPETLNYVFFELTDLQNYEDLTALKEQFSMGSNMFADDIYYTADQFREMLAGLKTGLQYKQSGIISSEILDTTFIDLKGPNAIKDIFGNNLDDEEKQEGDKQTDSTSDGQPIVSFPGYTEGEDLQQNGQPLFDSNGSDVVEGDDGITEEFVRLLEEKRISSPEEYEEILESMTDEEYEKYVRILSGEKEDEPAGDNLQNSDAQLLNGDSQSLSNPEAGLPVIDEQNGQGMDGQSGEIADGQENDMPENVSKDNTDDEENQDVLPSGEGILPEQGEGQDKEEENLLSKNPEEETIKGAEDIPGQTLQLKSDGNDPDEENKGKDDTELPEKGNDTENGLSDDDGLKKDEEQQDELKKDDSSEDADSRDEEKLDESDKSAESDKSEEADKESDDLLKEDEEKILNEESEDGKEEEKKDEPEDTESEGIDKKEEESGEDELKEDKDFDVDFDKGNEKKAEEFLKNEESEKKPVEELADTSDKTNLLSDEELMPETKLLAMKGMSRNTFGLGGPLRGGNSQEPIQTPVFGDGITIEKVHAKWVSKSTGETTPAGYGLLNMDIVGSEYVPNQQWQVDFSLSGTGYIEAGAIELTIPAYIWKTRDGIEPGLLTLACPEEPATNDDFAWRRVGDVIVITNTHALSAGTTYLIQGTFRMTYPDPNVPKSVIFQTAYAYQMVSSTVAPGSPYYGPEYYHGISDDFYGILNIITPANGQLLTMESNTIKAQLTTHVEAVHASKIANGKIVHTTLPASLPNELLTPAIAANPDDYYYVQWYVDGRALGNQPFEMTFSDTVADTALKWVDTASREPVEVHGIMLGATATADGTIVSADNKTISARLYTGYSDKDKSAYVWTAYPKTDFEEGEIYTLYNEQTITVTGLDDLIPTTWSARGEVSFRKPDTWTIRVVWIDDDNIRGRRPETAPVWVIKRITGSRIFEETLDATFEDANDMNMWWTTFVDDGSVSDFDPYEYSTYITYSTAYKIKSGYGDWVETVYGIRYRTHWYYHRIRTEYDIINKIWTFYNKYEEVLDYGSYVGRVYLDKYTTNHRQTYLMDTSDRDLAELAHNRETSEISYHVYSHVLTMPYTIRSGGNLLNPDDHFQRTVSFEVEDHTETFDRRTLGYEDYYIAAATLYKPTILTFTLDDNSEIDGQGTFSNTTAVPLSLYGLTETSEGSGEYDWVRYATIDANGAITTENGATATGNKVYFNTKVYKTKEILYTNQAYAYIGYDVYVKLLPSAQNKAAVETQFAISDYAMLTTTNTATGYLKYSDSGEVISSGTDTDIAYLHGRNHRMAVNLAKTSIAQIDEDLSAYTITNRLVLTQQSNITSKKEYDIALADHELNDSKSGVFYDLLPPGMTINMDSLTLSNGQIENAYTIENYQDTGRTMLIVRATLYPCVSYNTRPAGWPGTYPPDGQCQTNVLTFESKYSKVEAYNRGVDNLRNIAAYGADEDAFGNIQYWMGEYDAPTGENHTNSTTAILSSERALMSNLDKSKSLSDKTPTFVYGGASIYMTEIDKSMIASLLKHVQAVGDEGWTFGHGSNSDTVNVAEGGKYTYRISLSPRATLNQENPLDGALRDCIILDEFETYTPGEGDDDEGDIIRWKGKFMSVDTSELISMGIAPVVYYKTTPVDLLNYNVNGHHDIIVGKLTDPAEGWTTTLPANPADVKAIAIDCSLAQDGTPYILIPETAMLVYVHMKAPMYDEYPNAFAINGPDYTIATNNGYTYNNVYADVTKSDLTEHSYDHFNYTKVGIYSSYLDVEKEWQDHNDNDRVRPNSVTMHLYADGIDTGKSVVLTEAEGWEGKRFEHLPIYNDDDTAILYTIVEDEIVDNTTDEVLYEASHIRGENSIRVVNTHKLFTIDIPIEKTWSSDEPAGWESNIPEYAKFSLYKDGVFTGKTLVIRKNMLGEWKGQFVDLQKYKDGVPIVYTVKEDAMENYISTQRTEDGVVYVDNKYYPYGDLQFAKTVMSGTTAALQNEFVFTVSLIDANGESETGTFNYKKYQLIPEDATDPTNVIPQHWEEIAGSDGTVKNGEEITLKHNQKAVIKDIPSGTTYTVTEAPKQGFTLTSATNNIGTIRSDAPQEAQFVNTYSSNGQATFEAEKNLIGKGLRRFQFKFAVRDLSGTMLRATSNQLPATETPGKADVRFGAIKFTNADDGKELWYTIEEVNDGKDGYTYDPTIYYAKAIPVDNGDGTMSCTYSYYKPEDITQCEACHGTGLNEEEPCATCSGRGFLVTEGHVLTKPPFTNKYSAQGEVSMRAWKVLPQRQLRDDEFEFDLIYSGKIAPGETEIDTTDPAIGTVLQTKRNTADGSVIFDPIIFKQGVFSESGSDVLYDNVGASYFYTVRERKGTDQTVIYDESLYGYKVTPVDNGDGTLSFTQETVDMAEMYIDCATCNGEGYIADNTSTHAWQTSLSYDTDAHTLTIRATTSEDISEDYSAGKAKWFDGQETALQQDTGNSQYYAERTVTGVTSDNSVWDSEAVIQYGSHRFKIEIPDYDTFVAEATANGAALEKTDSINAPTVTECAACHGTGLVKNPAWAQDTHLMNLVFAYSADTLSVTTDPATQTFDKSTAEAAETGTIEWIASAVTASNNNNKTDIPFAADHTFSISDGITVLNGEEDEIFGSTAKVKFADGYTGYFTVPDFDSLQSDTVSVEVLGNKAKLPVFTNMLKDGFLKVSKNVIAADPSTLDPSQTFNFKVRLIGPYVEDKDIIYTLEQSPANSAFVINYNANGGTFGTDSSINQVAYVANSAGTANEIMSGVYLAPTKQGAVPGDSYAFAGWNESGSGNGQSFQVDGNGIPTTLGLSSMTVYAIYDKQITVTYYDNNNVGTDVTYRFDGTAWNISSGTVPTVENLVEWCTDPELQNTWSGLANNESQSSLAVYAKTA